LVIVKAGFSYG